MYAESELDTVTVGGGTLSDITASKDELGFDVYVDAIALFLLSDDTRPPLTLSVEGDWGSGKSTFMKLLGGRLEELAREKGKEQPLLFYFDAWREEKEESVWAAFVISFLRAIRSKGSVSQSFWQSSIAELSLRVRRFDLRGAALPLAAVTLFWLAGLAATVIGIRFALLEQDSIAVRTLWSLLGVAGIVSVTTPIFQKLRALLAGPWKATLALRRFVTEPNYRSMRGFGNTFAEDLPKIIASYVPRKKRVFIFIDDIDRAEPSQAATIMRGLSILTTTGQQQLVFVLGLDRRKVAAGIAMKNAGAIPYLNPNATTPRALNEAGLTYGLEFIEKLIQLPFAVPTPSEADVTRFIGSFSKPTEGRAGDVRNTERRQQLEVELEADSERVKDIVKLVAPLFDNNPRKIKQFINIFRLQAFIASETGTLGSFGVEELGIALAVLQKMPHLAEKIESDGKCLGKIQTGALDFSNDDGENGPKVKRLLLDAAEQGYDLSDVDFRPLLLTNPRRPRRVDAQPSSTQSSFDTTAESRASSARTDSDQGTSGASSMRDASNESDAETADVDFEERPIPRRKKSPRRKAAR